MSVQLEWIPWMPSPPLAPEDRPLDLAHLARMTFGDRTLEREVLALFAAQASDILVRLLNNPADRRMLAHTLKGAARGIGAFSVADAAEDLEECLRSGADPTAELQSLRIAVKQAQGAIEIRLGEG